MVARSNLHTQIDNIANRVTQAEKAAAKQVRHVLKSTEKFRNQQLKNVQALIKQAERLKATPLAKRAEQLRDELETKASAGLHYLMGKMNLPSRSEIDRLTKKISTMQKRIDELEKASKSS
jgi:polyhydroxyalkanoate synthesis regulator phasin